MATVAEMLQNEKNIANKNIITSRRAEIYVVNAIIQHIITQVSSGPTPNMDLVYGCVYKNQ